MSYRVFTIGGTVAAGTVEEGAVVESFTFRNGEITIPAIAVGEEGRGRTLGVLPVVGANVGDTIHAANIGETRSGKSKLIVSKSAKSSDKAIVVMRTKIGFRGSNSHTGDRGAEFPGEVLVAGVIAEGAAGRAGGGKQIIALIPKDVVFRTSYSGRLYGAPSEHFYLFDGEKITALTGDERELADLF